LKDYIGFAFRVRQELISGPDWLASEKFDIAATLPAGSTQAQANEMLKALLIERFQLKTHQGKKELPVYLLGLEKDGLKLQPSLDTGAAPVNQAAVAGGMRGFALNLGGVRHVREQ